MYPKKLSTFNPKLVTKMITDASKLTGIGFPMIQVHEDGSRALIACDSRATAGDQTRYSTYELAVIYGIRKCSHWLAGSPAFEVMSDPKPQRSVRPWTGAS